MKVRNFILILAVALVATIVAAGTASARTTHEHVFTPVNYCAGGHNVTAENPFANEILGIEAFLTQHNGGVWVLQNGFPFFDQTPNVGQITYFHLTEIQVTLGTCPVAPATPRGDDHAYLCYSKFEQDSGGVYDVTSGEFAKLRAAGYWKPFAVKGTAPSSAYRQVGAYYLSCNPAASLKPTGKGVDTDGYDQYNFPTYDTIAATVDPIVA